MNIWTKSYLQAWIGASITQGPIHPLASKRAISSLASDYGGISVPCRLFIRLSHLYPCCCMHSSLLTYHMRLFPSVGVLSLSSKPACLPLTGGEFGLMTRSYRYLGPTVSKCLDWILRTDGPYDLLDCRGQGYEVHGIEGWQHYTISAP